MATFLREGQDCHAPINGNQDRILGIVRIQACTLKRNIVFGTIPYFPSLYFSIAQRNKVRSLQRITSLYSAN